MRFLSNKEKKQLNEDLPDFLKFNKKDEIKEDKENIIYKNGEKYLIKINNLYIPHLNILNNIENYFPSVYIDKGAIPFILKGADLMRPGITKIDKNINKESIVIIKDENHNKNLAVGISLYSTEELKKQEKGKSIKIIHYFGDKYN
jgi:PUA domain protein